MLYEVITVDLRQRGDQPRVPLVGHQGDAAGLGDGDVGAADPHLRFEVGLAQLLAGDADQVLDLRRLLSPGLV